MFMLGEAIVIPIQVPANYKPNKNLDTVAPPPKAGATYFAILYPSDSLEIGRGKELLGVYDINWIELLFNSNFKRTFCKIPTDKPVAAIYEKDEQYIGVVTQKRIPGRGKQMSAIGVMWLQHSDTITDYYVVTFNEPG